MQASDRVREPTGLDPNLDGGTVGAPADVVGADLGAFAHRFDELGAPVDDAHAVVGGVGLRQGAVGDQFLEQRTALRLADPRAQSHAHRFLARASTQLDRLDDAHTHHQRSLDVAADPVEQARSHRELAYVCERQGRHDQALDHSRQAMELYEAAGHRRGQARALNAVGWYQALLGLPPSPPAHEDFGQVVAADGLVLLCLHRWGEHDHASLASADRAEPGNGLLLFFRVDDFEWAVARARALAARLEEEPQVNPSTGTPEFSLRDPDGYFVTISDSGRPAGH